MAILHRPLASGRGADAGDRWLPVAIVVALVVAAVAIGLATTGPLHAAVVGVGRVLWLIPHAFWQMYGAAGSPAGAATAPASAASASTAAASATGSGTLMTPG